MKLIRLLPPAVALLVVGTSLGLQRRAIFTTEQDCAALRDHLAAAAGLPPAKSADPNKNTKPGAPINWQTLAGQFDEMQRAGATADMRVMLRFQQRLQTMTREELIAGLDAIPALNLSTNSRSMLEQTLISPLIEKDPEYVLKRFIDTLQDDASGLKWHLPNALRDWARQDPATADAWLDTQIAAGKFDSKTLDGKKPFPAPRPLPPTTASSRHAGGNAPPLPAPAATETRVLPGFSQAMADSIINLREQPESGKNARASWRGHRCRESCRRHCRYPG